MEKLYESHKEEGHFDALVQEMTAGPCLVLCLARENAISAWRDKLGPATNASEEAPESIRGRFVSGSVNAVHAADSPQAVEREQSILFGEEEQAIAVIKPDAISKVSHADGFNLQQIHSQNSQLIIFIIEILNFILIVE